MPKPFFIYAEDDQNSVVLLRVALRKLGQEDSMVHLVDGDALIAALRDCIAGERLPAFVLLDIRMPKMSGFDALRWIRANPQLKTLPVVMISSSPLSQDVEMATALGATGYIVKPLLSGTLPDGGGVACSLWYHQRKRPQVPKTVGRSVTIATRS